MAHYEIRIESPEGRRAIVLNVEQPDDLAALDSALEVCRNQKIEVWDGQRRIGGVSISGTPRVSF